MSENFEDIKNTLEDSAEAYDRNVDAANNLPVWFSDVSRTQGTRNITVELWNTLCQNIAKLASDSTSQNEYIKAVTSALIDTITNVASITQTLIQFSQSVNEHNPVQYVSFNATDRTLTLRPLEGDNVVLNFNITSTIVDSEIIAPKLPTAAAVVKYFDTVSKPFFKIPSVPNLIIPRYVCGIKSSTREQFLIPANASTTADALICRDSQGMFHVKTPTADTHPVSLGYFKNKSNNSLLTEFENLQTSIAMLEYSATGNLYETVSISGNATRVQVKNALPYGLLEIPEGYSVQGGMVYDLRNAKAGSGGTYDTTFVSENSITLPKNSMYLVYIPVSIPEGFKVTVSYEGSNAAGDRVQKFGLFSGMSGSNVIGSLYSKGATVTSFPANAKCIAIYHTNDSDDKNRLLADLTIRDIVITVEPPDEGTLNALDLYNKDWVSHTPDGIITLTPNIVLEFGSMPEDTWYPSAVDFELDYKNKKVVS